MFDSLEEQIRKDEDRQYQQATRCAVPPAGVNLCRIARQYQRQSPHASHPVDIRRAIAADRSPIGRCASIRSGEGLPLRLSRGDGMRAIGVDIGARATTAPAAAPDDVSISEKS